jgi:hypothetical protein
LGGATMVHYVALLRAISGFGIFVINVLRIYYKNTTPAYPAAQQRGYKYGAFAMFCYFKTLLIGTIILLNTH